MTRLALVDVDGVLADYPRYWLDWAYRRLLEERPEAWGRRERPATVEELRALLGDAGYERLKSDFRGSGIKRSAPAREGATELLAALSLAGFRVVALSSRPVWRHARIQEDTETWLRESWPRDWGLYFGPLKWRTARNLRAWLRPEKMLAVEDDANQALGLSEVCDVVIFLGSPGKLERRLGNLIVAGTPTEAAEWVAVTYGA